ncbi:MAG: hypothetical protein ACK5NQ_16190 [Pseudomonas sp.]
MPGSPLAPLLDALRTGAASGAQALLSQVMVQYRRLVIAPLTHAPSPAPCQTPAGAGLSLLHDEQQAHIEVALEQSQSLREFAEKLKTYSLRLAAA